ncbi:MAG: hypothetical protein HY294_10115 [Candidatus Rokubacteria bacterium]|nr:hypothetical protein [Candidatus Rokubacteria bacterium]MBI3826339.1 hypothetical protein [Candidatus Rokubacteria bacterium]
MKPARPEPLPAKPATPGGAVIVRLTPERRLERAMTLTGARPADRCAKCGSRFVRREPAFIHCFYCGATARLPHGSLEAQEIFERRSGLRVAS